MAKPVVGQRFARHHDSVNVGMMSVKGRSSSANPNAAIAFDNSETKYLVDTIISIQPRSGGSSSGKSADQLVLPHICLCLCAYVSYV